MSVIFILEDDGDIVEVESLALNNVGYETKWFSKEEFLFEALDREKPDLILLDVMLPGRNGFDILSILREDPKYIDIPVILVTAKNSEYDKVRGLDSGADDYLTKPFGVMELISRVRAVLRRAEDKKAELEGKRRIVGEICLDDEKRIVTVADTECELTFKEYELLKLLILNEGTIISREEILTKIWGTDCDGESRTLDMHIGSIRKKLGEAGSKIKTIRNVGFVLGTKG